MTASRAHIPAASLREPPPTRPAACAPRTPLQQEFPVPSFRCLRLKSRLPWTRPSPVFPDTRQPQRPPTPPQQPRVGRAQDSSPVPASLTSSIHARALQVPSKPPPPPPLLLPPQRTLPRPDRFYTWGLDVKTGTAVKPLPSPLSYALDPFTV